MFVRRATYQHVFCHDSLEYIKTFFSGQDVLVIVGIILKQQYSFRQHSLLLSLLQLTFVLSDN